MKIPGWNLGGVGKPVPHRPWRTALWKRSTQLFPPKIDNTSPQKIFKILLSKKIFQKTIQIKTQTKKEEAAKKKQN